MSPRSTVILALLIATTLGSWYLSRKNSTPVAEQATQSYENRGYYLKAARILGTGPDGSLLFEIDAVHAEQRSDDRIEFTDVRIVYSPESDVR